MIGLLQQLQSDLAARYRIESELAEGGMAVVFRATDVKHDRQVAVKALRPELSAMVGADCSPRVRSFRPSPGTTTSPVMAACWFF